MGRFSEITLQDWEFFPAPGELPKPLCFAAYCMNSKRWFKLLKSEFPAKPPYPIGNDSVVVGFAMSQDLQCYRALGWQMPENVIDLHAEHLNRSNYLERAGEVEKSDLLTVLEHFKIPHITPGAKEAGRSIAMRGEPEIPEEWTALLDYCTEDVKPLEPLFHKLIGSGNFDQALQRGRYVRSVAIMECTGTPMDNPRLQEFRDKWNGIKWDLVSEVNADYPVFNGLRLSREQFADLLSRRGVKNWPTTPELSLPKIDRDTFKEKILTYPYLAKLHETLSTINLMRKESIAVGLDGRNRTSLHEFRAKTGRNQPSPSKFIFGAPSWMRSFAKPEKDMAIAYVDYKSEELGVAAVLSGDEALKKTYLSGDPYISFARLANAVPLGATKKTHPKTRELFKTCALGIQYGMSAKGLAQRLNRSLPEAEALIAHHQKQFPDFWFG